MDYEKILGRKPYSLKKEEKSKLYGEWLSEMTAYHRQNCDVYRKFLNGLHIPEGVKQEEEKIPMLPVGVFKDMELKSVPNHMIQKTMTSSGTIGQKVSKIYLDADTATNQQRALAHIGADFFGTSRLPLLIMDRPDVLKNRNLFSARGAGILGFSIFSSKICYALNQDMELDVNGIEEFLIGCQGNRVLIFGFTYIIWKYFYEVLRRSERKFNLKNAILIHGGGWKKLQAESVSSDKFKNEIQEVIGIKTIHNYYGMAEQSGCIYMECSHGNLHASIYSDIITRRPEDFSPCNRGEKGIIQVLSPLPHSYPGHSILTEDEGIIMGEDDCPCGRLGKYFRVIGRISQAQIRGCSDTYEA
ncbi:acyl-protein synthetase [Clostridium sp. E02]|uniref:LuxE/PaaK family acyltransferase n=1 Tax=Clostridium sp. E02 TaxID=2487134 RepID=UPI000F5366A1|nr:acyl-protein synthetase [Clostridium sp. E02]